MRSINILIVSVACFALSACSLPVSKHTLTDATNSTIDERLLGIWEIDLRPLRKRMVQPDEQTTFVFLMERAPDKENTLLATPLKDGKADGKAFPLYSTHMAMRDFLSFGESDDLGDKPCVTLLYNMTDDDHAQLYVMHGPFVAEQIDGGKIKGAVGRASDGQLRSIAITDTRENLRRFVIRSGDKLFDMEHPLPCKRIKPLITKE